MKQFILFTALLILAACSGKQSDVRYNQVGYYPGAEKYAVVVDSDAEEFNILDMQNKSVLSGKLIDRGTWDKSGEAVKLGSPESMAGELPSSVNWSSLP